MKKILISILLVTCWICANANEYPKKVRPYVIVDGDTFAVIENQTIYRLYGVDAPESDQPWGDVARLALRQLLHKRVVTLQKQCGASYGRPVVSVSVRGKDVGLILIRTGLAWHDPQYAPKRKDYAEAQKQAQQEKRGLWSESTTTPPWEFRAKRKYKIIDEE